MLGTRWKGEKHRRSHHPAQRNQQLCKAPAFCFEIAIYFQFSCKPFAGMLRRQAKPHPFVDFFRSILPNSSNFHLIC
jgi:hypothetical protein